MSRLDRAIEYLAPQWGAKRKLARLSLAAATELAAGHRDARPNRTDKAIGPRGASADYSNELGGDRRYLVDRARGLETNNVLACTMLDRSVESVCGEGGFRLRAMTKDPGWNTAAQELWEEWANDKNRCDARGLLTLPEMMSGAYRSKLRDGDVSLIKIADGTVRAAESDELASPSGGSFTRPDDVDGIELDRRGRPVSFTYFDFDPNIAWGDRRAAIPSRHVVVPARDVVFLARRTRLGQTRGFSAFDGISWLFEQLDGSLESITIQQRMAACFGLLVTRAASSNVQRGTDGAGNTRQKIRLEPGDLQYLGPGETVTPVQAASHAEAFHPHALLIIRLVGTRFSLPLEIALGDMTQANYSTMRAGLLQTWKKWRVEQHDLARAHSELYLWKLLSFMASGELPVRKDAFKHRWRKPGWQWVNPMEEIEAAQAAIDSGFETRSSLLDMRGLDLEHVVDELKRENELFREAGLPEVRSTKTRDPIKPASREAKQEAARARARRARRRELVGV